MIHFISLGFHFVNFCIWGIIVLSVLLKIKKLVTYLIFLYSLTYFILLVVQAEMEWMMEKRHGYFQTKRLYTVF